MIRALSRTDTAAFSKALIERLQTLCRQAVSGAAGQGRHCRWQPGRADGAEPGRDHEKIVNVLQVSAIIFVLCALVLRSVVGGLFVLIPLAIAVVVNLGLMGWSGMWLDLSTAAITAMDVSIGADFAIYLLCRMREEWRSAASPTAAVLASVHTSGVALCYVSSAVALGNLVLTFSGFSLWVHLGVLTAATVSVSAVSTLTVIPALVVLTQPRFIFGSEQTVDAVEQVAVAQSR